MSAHLSTLRRYAQQQGLQLVVCASHGVTRYAVIRDWWHLGLPILWYRTLGEVQAGLRPPEAGGFDGSAHLPGRSGSPVAQSTVKI